MGYFKNPEEMQLYRAERSKQKADSDYAKYCEAKENEQWEKANYFYEKSQEAYADAEMYKQRAEECKGKTFEKKK